MKLSIILIALILFTNLVAASAYQQEWKHFDGEDILPATVDSLDLKEFFQILKSNDFSKIVDKAKKVFTRNYLIKKEDIILFENFAKKGAFNTDKTVKIILYNDINHHLSIIVDNNLIIGNVYASDINDINKSRVHSAIDNNKTNIADDEYIKIFHNYLIQNHKEPKKFNIRTKKYGNYLIINIRRKGISVPIGSKYIMRSTGNVIPFNLENVNWMFKDIETALSAMDKESFVRKFIEFYSTEDSDGFSRDTIINAAEAIPLYTSNKMDNDLENVIRPMWSYKNITEEVFVAYTYEKTWGLVKRYKFTFHKENDYLSNIEELVLGSGIGSPEPLE